MKISQSPQISQTAIQGQIASHPAKKPIHFSGRRPQLSAQQLSDTATNVKSLLDKSCETADIQLNTHHQPHGRADKKTGVIRKQVQRISAQQIRQAIQSGQKLPLPPEVSLQYAVITPNGEVTSPYPLLKSILTPMAHQLASHGQAVPVFMQGITPRARKNLEKVIHSTLGSDSEGFAHHYKTPDGVQNRNVVLSDFVTKLISGQTQALPQKVRTVILPQLLDSTEDLYRLVVPGNPALTDSLNRQPEAQTARNKLLGLALAKKLYSEDMQLEVASVILSLVVGVLGEPTINAVFKDGGPVAAAVRTVLMSAIDIFGNILSVMGIVSEDLQARGKKLSLGSVFGKEALGEILKNPGLNGEAGPDIKRGILSGLKGGAVGVLFNIPAGGVLSKHDASVTARSILGGIGGAGSAVAIPIVVRESKKSFEASIKALIERGMISVPDNIRHNRKKLDQYVETIANRELMSRIGISSSVKATHVVPLIGTGSALLAAEKLGIPREYVQTAYMAVAPVMHNFLRLVFTGTEAFWTVPNRMKRLEAMVYQQPGKALTDKQAQAVEQAFLPPSSNGLVNWLTSPIKVGGIIATLLAAESLYFLKILKGEKPKTALIQDTRERKPQPESKSGTPERLASTPNLQRQVVSKVVAPSSYRPGTSWGHQAVQASYYPRGATGYGRHPYANQYYSYPTAGAVNYQMPYDAFNVYYRNPGNAWNYQYVPDFSPSTLPVYDPNPYYKPNHHFTAHF